MCGLCGLMSSNHWAEQGDTKRARYLRTQLVRRVLGHYGLVLNEWAGDLYVVSDRRGRTVVVDDIGKLWSAGESLAGNPLDPLDPALHERLANPAR